MPERFPYGRIACHCRPFLLSLVYYCCIGGLLTFLAGCSGNRITSGQAPSVSAPELSVAASPRQSMEEGCTLLKNGAFEEAIPRLTNALHLYEEEGKPGEQAQVLVKLSQAYQAIGEYQKALQNLERALVLARTSGNRALTASVLGGIGNVTIALGPEDLAYQYLNEGLAMAKGLEAPDVSAAILNNLGNLLSSQKRYAEATLAYGESAALAERAGNEPLACIALTNEATASVQEGRYQEAREILNRAREQTLALPPSHDKAYALINLALAYQKLGAHLSELRQQLWSFASQSLLEAVGVSDAVNDLRAMSYALGYLGKLYEDERRYQDALPLTARAVFAAQRVNAPESLYRWEWQSGRLLKALGQMDEALAAYRRANATLESIRQELSKCYGRPRTSFREPAGPLYLEFVDLLLQRAASLPADRENEVYLLEARDTLELLKISELRDYFRDDCVDAARPVTARLDVVSRSAVVIYPILLEDRTELLVSLPSRMKRFSVPAGAQTVKQEVKSLRKSLEKLTTREFLPQAQQLYNWLIRPLEEDLKSASADTLVFVPDGPLRTIPMAALHDGNQFLVSRYAIAITPGLDLTDPRPVERKNLNVLTLGLTEPVQGFPPLPFVSGELQAIRELYPGKLLLNQDFILPGVEKSLKDEHFTIVHIASHGQFERDVDKSFLLTFDDKLTMDRLNQYIGLLRFREDPLELLTLSACVTAAGDDRAALGLAGIAVKAGARSALGTLWHINDESSSLLVAEFYRQLRNPAISRAVALQRAQLKLLNDRQYQHPRYWSPFLLINNWL
jgi:CHAT domain-containing protein/Tfp pilus assembly protein PilF